jgi:transcription antitermination factor NusG
MTESYWAAVQTVSKMEHIVRREIEKTGHGAFLPTVARHRWMDGHRYTNERPLLTGYVFFMTNGEDWAGIPDIHGVYRVLPNRVADVEMKRLVFGHICRDHDETMEPRYTKYYRPPSPAQRRKQKRRRPRQSKRARSHTAQ